MGTSTMGSDLHSDKQDKLLKLQARKKELEQMLASKNEELYKLCVQEVQLTGVMPPEAPLSPEVPQRERLGSVKSTERSTDGTDMHDGSENSSQRRLRIAASDRVHDTDQHFRKNHSHRLSTPSISGMSTKSGHSRQIRRPETSCSNFFPSPPQERNPDTFSIHTSHTYPALASQQDAVSENIHHEPHKGTMYRHHTMTSEYMNKIYYNNAPEAHNVSRLRETHFSSSHPDIPTHYTQGNIAPYPVQNGVRNTPLLYQYASHLKARNQHLGAMHHHQMPSQSKRRPDGARNSLQRTQTYHLTSHSDYNQHLENMSDNYRHRSQPDIQEHSEKVQPPIERVAVVPNSLPLRERNTMKQQMLSQLQVLTDDYGRDERQAYPDALSPVSQISGYSISNFGSGSVNKFSPLSQTDMKLKEKQWYETSLDSPTKAEAPLLKKSNSLKRTSSIGNSQAYEIMISTGRHSAMQSPNQVPNSPPVLSPSAVSLDSPTNLTVIEQGKCIPYREESKPFEMSDFYKYSTKFRQTNNQKTQPHPVPNVAAVNSIYNKLPMELPQYSQDHWHGQGN
ncbi:stepping stone [Aphomia sociella]